MIEEIDNDDTQVIRTLPGFYTTTAEINLPLQNRSKWAKIEIKETFILIKLFQSTIPKLERKVRFKSVAGFLLWQPICITIRNTLVQNKPFHLLQRVWDTPV